MTYEEFQIATLGLRIQNLLAKEKQIPQDVVFQRVSEGQPLEVFYRMVAGLCVAGVCKTTTSGGVTWLVEVQR
jgi:hypothetical protein